MTNFGDDFGFGGGAQGGQGFGDSFGGGGGQDFGGGGQDFGGGFGGGGDFGETDSGRGKQKKEKKSSRRDKQADDMYGGKEDGGGFDAGGFDAGGGGFGGGGGSNFDTPHSMEPARNGHGPSNSHGPSNGHGHSTGGMMDQEHRPSAIAESMGQVPSSRGGGDYSGRRGELGLGDDFRNRDQGFNDPVERRNFGYVERDPSAGNFGGMEPVKRGFSFSFNDIPKAMSQPHYDGSSSRPERPRWSPFEGMRRNWESTRDEAAVVHMEPAHVGIHMGGHMASHPAYSSSAQAPGYPAAAPGTLENELFKTEERVAALRTKLSRLESDMVHGAQSPVSGYLRLVVTHLVAGGHLGLRMRGCVVSEIVNTEAREFGWFVGDQVMKVNGYQVQSEPEFAREVAKGLDGYRMTGRPLVFDVFRAPSDGMMSGKGSGMAPFPPGAKGGGMAPFTTGGKGGGMVPPGSKGGSYMGQDPQLERLAAENHQLRQDMIGQSMTMNGPPIGQSMMLSGPPMGKGGKGGPMGPFDTRPPTMDMLPPTSMRSMGVGASLPPGMMPPMSGQYPPTAQMTLPPSMGMMPPSYMGGHVPSSFPGSQTKRVVC